MQMKATGGIFAAFFIVLIVFSTLVAARPSFERMGSAIRSYHSSSKLLFAQNVPSVEEFWDTVLRQSAKAKAFAENVLSETGRTYQDVSVRVDEFKSSMNELVAESKEFRGRLHVSQISLDDLSHELTKALEQVGQAILEEFKDPLPENQDERYARREAMISFALYKIQVAFVEVCVTLGMQHDEAQATFERIRPSVHHVISVTGNIIDRHPVLLETIIFTGLFLIIPEAWLLRPLLNVVGFGPGGPVKGSMAAWLQRTFWGGLVKEGSWFAFLQRAGMKGVGWGWKIVAGIIGGIGAIGTTRGC